MHERLSVHNVTFLGASAQELDTHWRALGVRRLSVLDTQLFDPEFRAVIAGHRVEAVYHLFAAGCLDSGRDGIRTARDSLARVIEEAAAIGAQCVYLLTGGRGALTWDQAADRFCDMVGPGVEGSAAAGVTLAIENASSLYADLHIAHTLRDTVTLAERAGLGVCIDLFHCWAEADLPALVQRALPRARLVQLSDYVLGDRSLPCRAVPGDGAIPIEAFLSQVVSAGYRHGFDVELIGPRIEREGPLAASQRATQVLTAMLDRLGA